MTLRILNVKLFGSCLSGVDHLCEHRYPEATACLTLAIEKAEALFGPDGVELAPLLNNLAAVHEHQGQLAEVETTLLRALRIRENALGLCGDTGQSYANLGHLYLRTNTTRLKNVTCWRLRAKSDRMDRSALV